MTNKEDCIASESGGLKASLHGPHNDAGFATTHYTVETDSCKKQLFSLDLPARSLDCALKRAEIEPVREPEVASGLALLCPWRLYCVSFNGVT